MAQEVTPASTIGYHLPVRRWGMLFAVLLFSACAGPSRSRRPGTGGAPGLVKTATAQLGRPYRFGGASPEQGFDCSGLAWWTHWNNGIQIPRTSVTQFESGKNVGLKQARPGDLVFFTTIKSGPSHVGIYVGEGNFVHAPSQGKKVRLSSLSSPYWKKRFLGIRRYW